MQDIKLRWEKMEFINLDNDMKKMEKETFDIIRRVTLGV